ncbi:hypothetical protein [Aquimarina macrocephali]|uniref:hypothetical protein n=1 Tax=Aquimarina macrocephali TaxID=666563 RepID=UPI003F6642D8
MDILKGLIICFIMITVIKFTIYKLKKQKGIVGKFSFKYYMRDNWMDYFTHLSLSYVTFEYDQDVIVFLNYLFSKMGLEWTVPHVENNEFYFVVTPIALTALFYLWLRKKVSNPIQRKITPVK